MSSDVTAVSWPEYLSDPVTEETGEINMAGEGGTHSFLRAN